MPIPSDPSAQKKHMQRAHRFDSKLTDSASEDVEVISKHTRIDGIEVDVDGL